MSSVGAVTPPPVDNGSHHVAGAHSQLTQSTIRHHQELVDESLVSGCFFRWHRSALGELPTGNPLPGSSFWAVA